MTGVFPRGECPADATWEVMFWQRLHMDASGSQEAVLPLSWLDAPAATRRHRARCVTYP